jgi:hypothetical protein
MMNHDIDETGLEYEENQNALEQEAWESMAFERFENECGNIESQEESV